MTTRNEREKDIIATMATICASFQVIEYRIGLTATPSRRQTMYRKAIKLRYLHFVILATNLTSGQALELEKSLQTMACSSRSGLLYEKYDPSVRDKNHQPSLGGAGRYLGKDYSVYMTWR